jgi:hypothetical protein
MVAGFLGEVKANSRNEEEGADDALVERFVRGSRKRRGLEEIRARGCESRGKFGGAESGECFQSVSVEVEGDGTGGVASEDSATVLGGYIIPSQGAIARSESRLEVSDYGWAIGEDLAVIDMHDDCAFAERVKGVSVVEDRGVEGSGTRKVGESGREKSDGGHSTGETGIRDGVGLLEAIEGTGNFDPLAGERVR